VQFLLLIYDQEASVRKGDQSALHQEYVAFGNEFAAAIKGGNALQPTAEAKTVRVRDGKPLVTDGPFAETKEQLAGYYLIEANDAGEAVRVAGKIPSARSGSIEVRAIRIFS
jgi:hypothetical protein